MDYKDDIKQLHEKYYGQKTKKTRRGYKFCPCGEYIPCRSKTCPKCNKSFETGETYKPPEEQTPETKFQEEYIKSFGVSGRIVYIPSGSCPFAITPTKVGVKEWCNLLLSHARTNRLIYFPSVFKYWLNLSSPKQYKKLRNVIQEWFLETLRIDIGKENEIR